MAGFHKTALITGITGQDGSYLAELLLEKGYQVHGVVRRSSSFNRWRIDHLINDQRIYGQKLFLHYADLNDDASLRRIFKKVSPDEFYHLAGQSHVGLSFEIPELTTQEIASCTVKLLEICRDQERQPKIYLACSSEIFGDALETHQNEESNFNPTSPYGAAKAFCVHMGRVFRQAYGLFVCNGILYNHESPRRGENFVTQKIVRSAAEIAAGKKDSLELGNLEIERDWGHAKDYVEGMWLMLQQEKPNDYVLATGETHSLKDFLSLAFEYFELDYRDFVSINKRFVRPNEPQRLCGAPSKARSMLGWETTYSFEGIIQEMCLSAKTGII
ncbi:MAG: GDP-mannose 4,6-dehydratase [Opitutae bacterium]|jgi:GDPmannose 4,6-dehydratase|nr:GDP-mannose 4,6-dehydratase [Opitutae bacterium]